MLEALLERAPLARVGEAELLASVDAARSAGRRSPSAIVVRS